MARQIDWDAPLSEDDVLWLRNSGQPGMEERIATHQAQYDAEVPEAETGDDLLTASVLDPTARASVPVENPGASAPTLVDPTQADPQGDAELADDYDEWTVADLETEVADRNEIAGDREDVSEVVVEGTGKNGAVRKADLIKGLRLWDQEHPGVLEETAS